MRQYKANLNPLLSVSLRSREGQVDLLVAYQELRVTFAEWIPAEAQYAAAKSRRSSRVKEVADLRSLAIDKFSWALCAALDFQSAWKGSEASCLVGEILYHVGEWADEVHDASFPLSKEIARRDIAEEISEASAELHLLVCEELSM
ncbi:hypothetical protein [Streptomyces alkaliterrae]|nr:hypothetical protein [Streptomyces alkaliterrae]